MTARERKVLLRDVAQRAGVALSTASNVFTGNDSTISEQTRMTVLSAAKELGYQHKQRTTPPVTTIGLIIRAQALPFSDSPFYGQILRGAEQACAARNLALMYATVDEHASLPEHLPLMIQRKQVQALLLAGYFDPSFYTLIERTHLPYVLIDHTVKGLHADVVVGHDEEGGYLATQYLIEHGHRNVAMIVGPFIHTSLRERFNGYRRALVDFGIPYDEEQIYRIVTDSTLEEGYKAMNFFLQRLLPPTAIFCCNDHTALGALEALQDQNIAVPDRYSLIGYDDIKSIAHTRPPLTTVRIDQELLGYQAVWFLLERIERPEMPPRQVSIGVSLIERGSVKKLEIMENSF